MSERLYGRFTVLRPLGEGGMGQVLLVHDHARGVERALKRSSSGADPAAVQRAEREFAALVRVRHPALVEAYEFGFAPDGSPFLVMAFVPGLPIGQVVGVGDWTSALMALAPVCDALAALHEAGIVHGDVKPDNILVLPGPDRFGQPDVRVVDLGLARVAGTDGGGFAGTPGFVAPEVALGEMPGPASDLYGLGATLWALLAGSPPPPSTGRVAGADALAAPRSVLKDVPPALATLIRRLLAPAASERLSDVREVRRAFERLVPALARPLSERLRSVRVVGRERLVARVTSAHRRARRRPQRIVLTGEARSGRSTLLDHLGAQLALDGARVVRIPDSASPVSAAQALTALDDGGAPVGSLADRSRVVIECLARLAAGGAPAVILVDDAERLPNETASWLRRIALDDSAPHLQIWVAPDPPPGDLEVFASAGAQQLLVEPLTRHAMGLLVSARLGRTAPEALVEETWRASAGNPGAAIAWLGMACDHGALIEVGDDLRLVHERLATLATRGDRLEELTRDLDHAGPDARRLFAAVACAPRPLPPLAGEDAAVTRLRAAGWVRLDPWHGLTATDKRLSRAWLNATGPREVAAAARDTLARTTWWPEERARLLADAGDIPAALAVAAPLLEQGENSSFLSEMAALAAEIGDPRSVDWWMRAGSVAREQGDYPAAERAFAALLAATASDDPRHLEALVLRGAALRVLGRHSEIPSCVDRLAEPIPDSARAGMLVIEAERQLVAGHLAEHDRLLAEAHAAAEASGHRDRRLMVLLKYAMLHSTRNDFPAAWAALQAMSAVDPEGTAIQSLLRPVTEATVLTRLGRSRDAEAALEAGIARATALQRRYALVQLLLGRAVLLGERGDWNAAASSSREAERIAIELGLATPALTAAINHTIMRVMSSGARGLRVRLRGLLRRARMAGHTLAPVLQRAAAIALQSRGAFQHARRRLERILAEPQGRSDAASEAWTRLALSEVLESLGDLEGAEASVAVLESRPIHDLGQAVARARLAWSRARTGDRAGAEQALGAVTASAFSSVPHVLAHLGAARALLALHAGRADEGIRHALEAARQFESLPSPVEHLGVTLALAETAISAQLREAPLESWLESARERAERLGDAVRLQRCLELTVAAERLRSPDSTDPDATLLSEITALLQALPDLDVLARRALALAIKRLGAEQGALLRLGGGGELEVLAEQGPFDEDARDRALSFSRAAVRRVMDSGRSIVIEDLWSSPGLTSRSLVDLRVRSVLAVPLAVGGRTIGALYLDDRRRPGAFDATARRQLEAVAHVLGAALDQSVGQDEAAREEERRLGQSLQRPGDAAASGRRSSLIGAHPSLQAIERTLDIVGPRPTAVLISGETGTGKELVARELHHRSRRRDGPFVAVNCGAIVDTMLEAELFGIADRTASGVRARAGHFQRAHGGTLFLDEIGDMPLAQQVALLRALQEREVHPVGAPRPVPVDVRVVAATNRDLRAMVERGQFREDLFFRLAVVEVRVPALRERKSDIPLLTRHFVSGIALEQGRPAPRLTRAFLAALIESDWPGNVRELENYLERIMAMTPEDETELSAEPPPNDKARLRQSVAADQPELEGPLREVLARVERWLIERALQASSGNQSLAARSLRIPEPALRYRLKRLLGISPRHKPRTRKE